MARNGAGTYVLTAGNPVVTGTTISSAAYNTLTADLATALTNSMATNGESVVTNNLPMGGFKLTGLAAGTVAGDSVRFDQLTLVRTDLAAQDGSSKVGFIAGGTGAIPRTLQDKARELVSVWDYFLAAEADHTGMFNRATAASARVYAPAGNYTVHAANFPANTEIFGDGENRTIITQRAGATATYIFTCDSGSAVVANNITGLRLSNLQLRGTCDTDGFSQFMYALNLNGVTDVKIQHVKFKGFRGDGLYLGSSNTAGVERHNQRVLVLGCTFDGINNANRNGISVIDCDDLTIEKCYFVNTTSSTMPGAIDLEPNNDAFPILKNVTIRNNRFENIGGNVGCVCANIPPAVTALSHNITVENNRFINYTGTGFSISYNTNRVLGIGSEDNNIKIVRNKGSSGAAALNLAAVKGVKLLDNEFTDYTGASSLGGATAITGIFDVYAERNTFRRNGSAGSGIGLAVGTVGHIEFVRNKIIDCGTGAGGSSNGIYFATGTSSRVSFDDNSFEAPAGKTLIAIQKDAGHTFTPAGNAFNNNALNGLANNFQWAKGDAKQIWLPVVSGATTAGACTYAAQAGRFVRIGDIVHFSAHVGWTGHTGTGQITVSLPAVPSTDVDFSPLTLVVENVGYTAGSTPCALMAAASGVVKVYQQSVGAGITAVPISAGSGLYISGSYIAA